MIRNAISVSLCVFECVLWRFVASNWFVWNQWRSWLELVASPLRVKFKAINSLLQSDHLALMSKTIIIIIIITNETQQLVCKLSNRSSWVLRKIPRKKKLNYEIQSIDMIGYNKNFIDYRICSLGFNSPLLFECLVSKVVVVK